MNQKAVVAFAGLTTIFFAVTIAGVMAVSTLETPVVSPASLEPPARFMPGEPLPKDASCNWPLYRDHKLTCVAHLDNGQSIWLLYDTSLKTIRTTSISVPKTLRIGDVILLWSEPTSANGISTGMYLYWEHSSAYVLTTGYQPNSRAILISYLLKGDKHIAWKGFAKWRGFGKYE
jgi:hypothetical protein